MSTIADSHNFTLYVCGRGRTSSVCTTLNYITPLSPPMALGEMIGEGKGKVVALRALENGRIEVNLQGTGKLLGVDFGDVTTFWSDMRPNGTAYGDGNSIFMASDGMAEWKGSGVGKPTGATAWKYSYGGAFKKASSPKWERLLGMYTVGEYQDDESGNYTWKLWEWKL